VTPRQRALQEESAALERLKIAAVDLVAATSGGYSTTRLEDSTPMMARARLVIAAKAWVAASHRVVDAIVAECPEERRAHEGRPREVPVRVHQRSWPEGEPA
jgi:hypothetical protein